MNALSGSLLGSFFALLGSFLKHFSVPGSTLGALWAHFLNQKSAWGSKGAPRGATPEINSHFWRPFGFFFLNIFFFARQSGLQSVRAGAVDRHFSISRIFSKT